MSRRDPTTALIFPSRRLATIYLFLTGSLLFLVFLLRRLFADDLVQVPRRKEGMGWDLLRNSQLRFGFTAAFLYVGSEATLLSNAIPYLSRHGEGFLPATAASMLSIYWASVLVGRLCAVGFLRGIDTRTLLQGACGLAFSLLLLLCMDRQNSLGGIGMLSVGLCNAIMFPSIFTLSVSGLREDQLPHASALLSTAICGGAVMPVLGGLLMDRFGVVWAFAPPCVAYAFIGGASTLLLSARFPCPIEQPSSVCSADPAYRLIEIGLTYVSIVTIVVFRVYIPVRTPVAMPRPSNSSPSRRTFLTTSAAALVGAGCSLRLGHALGATEKKPNIVFFFGEGARPDESRWPAIALCIRRTSIASAAKARCSTMRL